MAQTKPKRIFPDSSPAKRWAVRAMRAYARIIPSVAEPLAPTDDSGVRILIQSMGGIGNTLMATPLIAETRRCYPNARIDVLTSPGAAQLLQHDNNISNVIPDPHPDGTLSLIRRIRATKYDAALVALNAHLSKFAMRIVFGAIPRRLMHGYAFRPYDDFSSAYTHVLERPAERHDVACNIDLLRELSSSDCSAGPLQLSVTDEAADAARKRLSDAGWYEGTAAVALCQGSSDWMAFKRWPLDNAMAFAEALTNQRAGTHVFAFCGPDEVANVSRWQSRFGGHDQIHVIEPMPIAEYAAAIGLMSAVVANDSLPMHIAAARQVPVAALFGPTEPALTGPWQCPHRVIQAVADYAPYYELPYPLDPNQFPDCMAEITPDTVIEALDDLLRNT